MRYGCLLLLLGAFLAGGAGADEAEWETSDPPPSVADPNARKGGSLVLATTSRPETIRTEGPSSRLDFLDDLHGMVYETLLGYDPATMGFYPRLARYWQVGEDRTTFRFRLDERARWAGGRPVTADDVVATLEHLRNPDRKDPLVREYWDEIVESAKALDEHTVEIRTRHPRWRNLVAITLGMRVYPAAYARMDGETYLRDWNWKLPPGSGPYEIRPEDVTSGRSITLRRRPDWWGAELPENRGVANFDAIEWKLVGDEAIAYEKLLARAVDMVRVGRSKQWVEELAEEHEVGQGWIQRRRIYSRTSRGFGGFCLNFREKPFDDSNVRGAFAHLFNRERIFQDFLHDQYEYTDSYFPGQPWARPDAKRVRYDPEEARRLLARSGWSAWDSEGHLTAEDGERFPPITLSYAAPGFGKFFEVVQHDLWEEAGIRVELKIVDYSRLLKRVWAYDFQLVYWSWTASFFPDPYEMFHSSLADRERSNNLNGFRNAEADRLMEDYRTEWDPAKRREMLQRLDRILFDAHLYALGWWAPHWRILYWDKFGHPPEYVAAHTREWQNVMWYWWYDPKRWIRTLEGMSTDRPNHPSDDVEQEWWRTHTRPMPR